MMRNSSGLQVFQTRHVNPFPSHCNQILYQEDSSAPHLTPKEAQCYTLGTETFWNEQIHERLCNEIGSIRLEIFFNNTCSSFSVIWSTFNYKIYKGSLETAYFWVIWKYVGYNLVPLPNLTLSGHLRSEWAITCHIWALVVLAFPLLTRYAKTCLIATVENKP